VYIERSDQAPFRFSRPRPVLHILGTAKFEGTGIARIVGQLASGLGPSAYRVHACFLGEPGPLVEELRNAGAITQHIGWKNGARDPAGAWRFWRYLRGHDFAIVHQHFGARSVRLLAKAASRSKLLVHLHARIDEPVSIEDAPVAIRGADRIIAASRSIARQVAKFDPAIVYTGVPTSADTERVQRSARQPIVIGTACRLIPLKGVLDLLRAFAALHSEFPGMRLEIAGSGPAQRDLERESERLGLTEHVRFLGWRRDIGAVMRTWNIFVLPSLDEGLGIAVLDAMAEALPVVGTLVGGIPELIEDGGTGFLVPPCDPEALAGRLRCLIREPERRSAQGAAGRERVQSRFSADQMVAQIRAIYDALLLPQPETSVDRR
jgi:glycosyltransferase involved in cell wall biosynthesis